MKTKNASKFIGLFLITLTLGGLVYYFGYEKPAKDNEVNIFMPDEYDKKSGIQEASLLSETTSIKKFDYYTLKKTNDEIRAEYANCIRNTKNQIDSSAYDLTKITCEQDVSGFLKEIERLRKSKSDEIIAWWKKVRLPANMSRYQDVHNCIKNSTKSNALDVCLGDEIGNHIYFIGTWMRQDVNALVAHAFTEDQLDYIYLGGSPGEHTFRPYDTEDAYFWYCYFKEEDTYFDKIFKNVHFEGKNCTADGDVIYRNKKDGPSVCCTSGAEIITAAIPSNVFDMTSKCISPENEIRGRCMPDWYNENNTDGYCGDNVCQTARKENQCNCMQDCPQKNVISFTNKTVYIKEGAKDPVSISIERSDYMGIAPMKVEYFIKPTDNSPAGINDYEIISDQVIRFDENSKYAYLKVIPEDDKEKEGIESVTITLTNPYSLKISDDLKNQPVVGGNDTITVYIQDND